MKKLLILLIICGLNSVLATGKYLTKEIVDKDLRNKNAQLSPLHKFVRDFADRGSHERVSRWFNVKNEADQQRIIDQEKYNWQDYVNSDYPELWPTMIHCFSQKIDQNLLDYAFFREVKKNHNNKGFDSSVYATVMAAMYYRNQVSKTILAVPGLLEFGYNSKDGQLYHRCFKGIGWAGFEESLDPVSRYGLIKDEKFYWNTSNLESNDFKSEQFPDDLITRVYKPKSAGSVNNSL